MRNVTISLDEKVLKALRTKAAKEGVSFQEYVRSLLKREAQIDAVANLQEFFDLADRINKKSDGKYLRREELYDRPSLRRFESDSVRPRSKGSSKKRAG
jgi:plasmid stability protein